MVPDTFISACHALTGNLGFVMPWPTPVGWVPPKTDSGIVISGSSSIGMYVLQVLKYYGYRDIVPSVSTTGMRMSARRSKRIWSGVQDSSTVFWTASKPRRKRQAARTSYFGGASQDLHSHSLDAAPGLDRNMRPIHKLARQWPNALTVFGVRTHINTDNALLPGKLQPEIVQWAIAENIVKSNDQVIVGGDA